jgi:anti-anti-sigma factor
MAPVSDTAHVVAAPESVPSWPRVAVVGEIDLDSAPAFAAELISILDRSEVTHLTIDLNCVDFLAAAGAHVLLQILQETARRGVRLEIRCAPTRTTATVLRLCGLPTTSGA